MVPLLESSSLPSLAVSRHSRVPAIVSAAPSYASRYVEGSPEVKLMSRRPLPNALDLDLQGGLTDAVTPHAGIALLIDLGRRSGVLLAADQHLPPKKSGKGLGHAQFVEAFVLLSALGGECLD